MPPSLGSSTPWMSMKIPDDELRALVRNAISKRAGGHQRLQPIQDPAWNGHASHGLLQVVRSGGGDDHCLIEPAVPCSHCGYCLSLGH